MYLSQFQEENTALTFLQISPDAMEKLSALVSNTATFLKPLFYRIKMSQSSVWSLSSEETVQFAKVKLYTTRLLSNLTQWMNPRSK